VITRNSLVAGENVDNSVVNDSNFTNDTPNTKLIDRVNLDDIELKVSHAECT